LETVERFEKLPGKNTFGPRDTLKLQVAVVNGEEILAQAGAAHLESGDPNRYSRAGALGTGVFSSFARNFFVHDNGRTTGSGQDKLNDREALTFDYEVSSRSSGFKVSTLYGEAIVGERGTFWVDAKTLDLMRMEIEAVDIPFGLGVLDAF